ncbi:MAG TPA: CHASE2 domain-containing protein, partial [Vicinamibacterales bacterium]|nr:CHASE2 domain-containing protein [Vicinamibacterales bacterium]
MASFSTARPTRRRLVFLSGIAAVAVSATLAIVPPPSWGRLDDAAYDLLMRSIAARPTSGRVVIVDADERSLSTIGQWPWSRDVIGKLIASLRDMGAATIALDMVFAEPDRYGADDALAAVLREGRVVLGVAMRFDDVGGERSGCVLHPVSPAAVHADEETQGTQYFHATAVVCNLAALANAAGTSGFMNAAPDADGILRRVPLLIEFDGRVYPSLALAATMAATGSRDLTVTTVNVNSGSLTVGDRVVPIDGRANGLVRYRGGKQTFPYLSAADVISGRVASGILQDKIVFVGTTALGTREVVATPLDTLFVGVEVQATVADNLLQQDFLRTSPLGTLLDGFVVLVAGILVVWVVARKGTATGVFGTIASIAVVWYVAGWVLSTRGLFVSPVMPTVSALATLAAMTLAKFTVERGRADTAGRERTTAQRLMVQTLLSLTETRDAETGRHSRRTQQYVKALAEQLAANPRFRDDLTPERIELMSSLAPLHDIGKVGVPDHILNKPGALTPEELVEMQKHPQYGYEVILKAEGRVGVRDDAILA